MPDGKWWPVAGNGEPGSSDEEMPALDAPLTQPTDLWLDSKGHILIADTAAGRIREIVPSETVAPPAPITESTITAVHAATLAEQEFAPGQLILVRGHGLTADAVINVDGRPSTTLSAKNNEIVALMPAGIGAGVVELALSHGGKERAKTTVRIAALAPGLFAVKGRNRTGGRRQRAWDAQFSGRPRAARFIISLFGTGQGAGGLEAMVTIGGIDAEVVYAGPAPGQTGVFQINARTPSGFAPSGVVPVAVTIKGKSVQTGLTIVTR